MGVVDGVFARGRDLVFGLGHFLCERDSCFLVKRKAFDPLIVCRNIWFAVVSDWTRQVIFLPLFDFCLLLAISLVPHLIAL